MPALKTRARKDGARSFWVEGCCAKANATGFRAACVSCMSPGCRRPG
ncbi:hypothetical protein [Primorskyibacter flagellatus]